MPRPFWSHRAGCARLQPAGPWVSFADALPQKRLALHATQAPRHDLCRTLYKLLRCVCLHCFKFRMAAEEVARYEKRLALLGEGRLVEACRVTTATGATVLPRLPQLHQPRPAMTCSEC